MYTLQPNESSHAWVPACRGRRLLLGGACVGMLLLYVVALWWGELNQDEGWYLYAGRLVREGQMPYRDFLSTQGPVMAYVYAAAYPLVAWGGVLGGRLFTAALGLVAVGLAADLARRMALRRGLDPFWPVLLVIAFGGLNLYQVYFTSIVKTYALAAVFLLGGLVLLECALALAQADGAGRARMVLLQAMAGGLLLAAAAGTRLSAAMVLPACWVPVAMRWLRAGRKPLPGYWLLGLFAGGAAGIILLFGPFLVICPQGLRFGLLEYHGGRTVGSGMVVLAYKAGFLLRVIQAYWPLVAAGILVWLFDGLGATSASSSGQRDRLHIPLWTCFLAVTMVHLLATFPYDDYQVFVVPVAVVAIAIRGGALLGRWNAGERMRLQWMAGLLVVLLLFSLSNGLLQGWLLAPRDRIWWPLRSESSLAQLRRVGRILREGQRRPDVEATLLTQDIYVAVEAGFRVPAGMEMGPFSNFLDLSDAEAARLGVVNRERLLARLADTEAPWAAYSDYGFAIQAPGIIPISDAEREMFLSILRQRYAAFVIVPAFGQAQTDLHVYKRRLHE